jgi:DNA replication protein DnaC
MPDPQPLRKSISALRDASRSGAATSSAPAATPKTTKSGPLRPTSGGAETTCPRCGGAGFLRYDVPYGDPNFGRLRECPDCQTVASRRAQAMQAMSSLRGKLVSYRFKDFKQVRGAKEAYDAAVAFAKNPQGWLVILGPNGNGKTHLAAAITNYLLERNVAVVFLSVPDLLDYLRNAFAPRKEWDDSNLSFEERFEAIKNAPVLILDDFGAETETPWANEKLYQILNYRTDLALPTVITGNLKLSDVESRLRSRLGNRLLGKVVQNNAPDYRRGVEE